MPCDKTSHGWAPVLETSSLYHGHSMGEEVGEATESTSERFGRSRALKNDFEWCAKNVDLIPRALGFITKEINVRG